MVLRGCIEHQFQQKYVFELSLTVISDGELGGTSFPTIIAHHPLPTIEAAVSFMSKEDFAKHVETAIDLVKEDDDGNYIVEASLKRDSSYSLVNIFSA